MKATAVWVGGELADSGHAITDGDAAPGEEGHGIAVGFDSEVLRRDNRSGGGGRGGI